MRRWMGKKGVDVTEVGCFSVIIAIVVSMALVCGYEKKLEHDYKVIEMNKRLEIEKVLLEKVP